MTVEHILAVNRACEAPFRERLAALLSEDQAARDDVACLVADAHLLTLLDVARGLGVPTLVLRTGSAACLRMFAAFPCSATRGTRRRKVSTRTLSSMTNASARH